MGYRSAATGQEETIKIEVSLREPLLTPAVSGEARTLLVDPINGRALAVPVSVPCMSLVEAFAEKFRAALSRLDVAIRDFFDLDYAVGKLKLKADDAELVRLVKQKLAVPGTGPVDVSERRLAALRQQVEPQLRPVLRKEDFIAFDVDRAIQLVTHMAAKVS